MNIPVIAFLIVIFGVINLLRMAMFLVGADFYRLRHSIGKKKNRSYYSPLVSVIIPAYNEGSTVLRAISSVLTNGYSRKHLEVIVVDDGSTDDTPNIVKKYIKDHPSEPLRLVRQKNAGKARALNRGIKKYAQGKLIMCLDADSALAPNAIKNAVWYFKDRKVAALSTNIKIIRGSGLLNLIQRFEYLIGYQMKRAESLFNFEYIVGGIGSTFRRSVLKKVGYYDTNTVTEDIDLTMKILKLGNKNYKAAYGADVVAYTEGVLSVPGLMKQRYRWKWGRCQTFLKNLSMFFSTEKKYSKSLTCFYLPLAIYGDLAFFFEPILMTYILVNSVIYRDPLTILSAFTVISLYIVLNILAEDTLPWNEKPVFLLTAPLMYLCFYILSFVEYVALIRAAANLPTLGKSIKAKNCGWTPVDRPAIASLKLSV